MVAKQQFRVTTDTLSPLYKASIGFDQLVNEFFNEPSFVNTSGYPPYNISKGKDDVYEITLAVAGFKKDDIDIGAFIGPCMCGIPIRLSWKL